MQHVKSGCVFLRGASPAWGWYPGEGESLRFPPQSFSLHQRPLLSSFTTLDTIPTPAKLPTVSHILLLPVSCSLSSLHNIIFNYFRILFVQTELSTSYVIVVQKSSSGDGKFTLYGWGYYFQYYFLALFHKIYTIRKKLSFSFKIIVNFLSPLDLFLNNYDDTIRKPFLSVTDSTIRKRDEKH